MADESIGRGIQWLLPDYTLVKVYWTEDCTGEARNVTIDNTCQYMDFNSVLVTRYRE